MADTHAIRLDAGRIQPRARQRDALGVGARRRPADQLDADLRELAVGRALWPLIAEDRAGVAQPQWQRLALHAAHIRAQHRGGPFWPQRQLAPTEVKLIDFADQLLA